MCLFISQPRNFCVFFMYHVTIKHFAQRFLSLSLHFVHNLSAVPCLSLFMEQCKVSSLASLSATQPLSLAFLFREGGVEDAIAHGMSVFRLVGSIWSFWAHLNYFEINFGNFGNYSGKSENWKKSEQIGEQ